MKARIVIMSGPSGVGKDTLLDAWMRHNPSVERVVTYTTRAPRKGEVNGRDYNFVDEARFDIMAKSGDFWEYKNVHGFFYGSPRVDTNDILERGDIPVLKIDVHGALDVMKACPEALTVFILPPSMEELERRIRFRASDDEATIQKRLKAAQGEIDLSSNYQIKIVNDDISKAVLALEAAIRS